MAVKKLVRPTRRDESKYQSLPKKLGRHDRTKRTREWAQENAKMCLHHNALGSQQLIGP